MFFQMFWELVRFVLEECFSISASDKKLKTGLAIAPLLDHNPLVVDSGFDTVNLDRGLTDRQANAFDVSHPAGIIRENCEVHIMSSVIEFAFP